MDELDDLINDIIGKKPQAPKKPEVSSLNKPKKEPKEELKKDEKEQSLIWAKIPARKRNPHCGFCKRQLRGGESHWQQQSEDRKGNVEFHWWCQKCLDGILEPPTN